MQNEKIQLKDILVIAAAFIAIVVCIVVLATNYFSFKEDEAQAQVTAPPLSETAEPTPEPTETPEPTPEPTAAPAASADSVNREYALAAMEAMTTEEKIWQLFLVSPESISGVSRVTATGNTMKSSLADCPAGGLIYAASNIKDADQLRDMLLSAQKIAPTALFITNAYDIYDTDLQIDGRMYYFGFNLCFGQAENGLISALPYAPDMSVENLGAVIASADLIPIETEAEQNSTEETDETETSAETPNDMPQFMSKDYVNQIRQELDWDGIIVTEQLSDGIEGYSDEQLALGALSAGCDMIAGLKDPESAVRAIVNAVTCGDISQTRLNESIYRILLEKLESGILTIPVETETEE